VLHISLGGEHRLFREDLDAQWPGGLGRVGRSARLEPAEDDVIPFLLGLQPFPARVRHLAGCLIQHQAVLWRRQVYPSPTHLARQPVIVSLWVVAKQAEPEAVLARRRAVALAGVTPSPGQHRQHVDPETRRRVLRGLANTYRNLGRETGIPD
jgi:hypothetical protein